MDYIHILRRRKEIIAGVALGTFALGILILFFLTPKYQANGKLLLNMNQTPNIIGDFMAGDIMTAGIAAKGNPVKTQIEILKTRPILDETVRRIRQIKPEITEEIGSGHLYKKISAEAIPQTNLIQLSYQNEDPEIAMLVINTLSNVFINQNREFNQEELAQARQFIEKQLEQQEKQLKETEQAVLAYKKETNTIGLGQETETKIESLAKLEAEKLAVETKLQGVYAQKKELEHKTSQPGSRNNSFYTYWMTNLEQVNSEITQLKAQTQNIQLQIDRMNRSLTTLPPKEVELARLLRNQELANEIYTNLLSRYEEIKINEAAKIASIKLIEPAVTPEKPVFPNKKKFLMFIFLLSIALGGGLGFAVDYIDDRPKGFEEVTRYLPYSTVGKIPYIQLKHSLFIKEDPSSLQAEALRISHTNLKFKSIYQRQPLCLMLTSALGSEGKSTLVANLGYYFANLGKKTILVNLDLRKPGLSKIFHLNARKGLSNYLIGDTALQDIIHSDLHENLSIIPSGVIPPNPTELIASPGLPEMLQQLKKNFDVIIFDPPPITLVAETLDTARLMDGVLLVVDMQNTKLSAIKAMGEMLKDKNLPIAGIIFNKVSSELQRYYTYYGTRT